MTVARSIWRAGPIHWSWLAVLCLLVFPPTPAAAQVPDTVPEDTVVTDTVQVQIPPEGMVADTVPIDSIAQDSAVPVPPFPRYVRPGRGGWAFGRWEWDRQALLRYHSLSLLQLLERVPGISALRLGDFGQPAGVVTFGGAGGRLRVYLDGFELDPLGFTTFDLQQIALGDLESVRVERRLDGIRIDLTPLRLPDARPLSAVEAATGVYDTKLLRALLLRGVGRRTTVSAAFDQVSSRGVGFDEAFSYGAARAAFSYALTPRTAIQAEYRSENGESGQTAVPLDANRRTVLLRGRSELRPGLIVDAMLGRTARRPEESDTLDVDLSGAQGALRASYDLGRLWAEGAARMRTNADDLGLPVTEFEARGGLMLLPWLLAEGELRAGGILGASGTRGSATLRIGPLAGLSAFGTVALGDRAMALVRDSAVEYPTGDPDSGETEVRAEPRFSAVSATAGGLRVGTDWALTSGSLGAAAVLIPEGHSVPFGFPTLDRGFAPVPVGQARGLEAYAFLPVPFTRELLRLEGWYTWWPELGGRPFVPEQEGRLALQIHGLFYGGDLEPSLRLEGVHRGTIAIPTEDPEEPQVATLPYSLANLQLEIRILDVRAFFVLDNITNVRTAADIPGRLLPGARFYYGLRWTFRN